MSSPADAKFRSCGFAGLVLVFGALLITSAVVAFADDHASAGRVFQDLRQSLVLDRKRADWNAYLRHAEKLKAFLNSAPISSLEVARAQLQLGHRAQALAQTVRFLAMGQTNDILSSPPFRPLKPAIEGQLTNNQSPIAWGRLAFRFADAGLLPEDIDYDPNSSHYFATSILEHKIVSLDQRGNSAPFATSPDRWPMVALKVDPQRRRLWATEVAFEGFKSVAPADWGRSVLLEYDLARGTLLARYDGPRPSGLGDMVLAGNGDPIVSDGDGGGIYRLRGGKLQRIDHGDFISPQTIAICDDDRTAFVPDYVRGIARFDLSTGAVRWISMRDRYALDGTDGLYCSGNSLIAAQNGTSPERVVAFALDPGRNAVVGESIVERATPNLGDPTHGVLVGKTFYYIANSGWNAIDEHGIVKPSAHLAPADVMAVDVLSLKSTRGGN